MGKIEAKSENEPAFPRIEIAEEIINALFSQLL